MAQQKSQSKRRSQGGGRTANSEPRLQVFKQFGGCNFEESPREFDLEVHERGPEQADLQMNYVVVQNNALVTTAKTIETRNQDYMAFPAPSGERFTPAAVLIDGELYIATESGKIAYGSYGKDSQFKGFVNIVDNNPKGHHWESLAYYDDKLIGTTTENQLWTGEVGTHSISNAKKVPDPEAFTMSNLVPRGSLKLSATMTDECCFRTGIAYSYVNKYGPTKCSRQISFYSNYPVDEWHSGCFLQINGTAPTGYGIIAAEIYYNVDNASSLQFAGRTDMTDGGSWSFSWIGYLDITSMWPMANLLSPTENYTEGVPASHVVCIDGRMYFWGDKEQPYRLYIGGNPGNLFSISPGTGGGFVDVEPGTGQEIRVVTKYKTQSGNSIVTMLCDSPNSSREQRFNLVENTVTISNEQSMKSWQAEQVAGAVGCKSYRGALVCEDGLYSVSRYGLALTTMTMEYNSQIRANYVSDPIKPVFIDKIGEHLSDATLLEADGILYLAFGKGGGKLDNLLFCYDINAKAWWTYSIDTDEPILGMIHLDHEAAREGIGIICGDGVILLPTTIDDDINDSPDFDVLFETGELSAQQPQQSWIYLSQVEFRFDRFVGDLEALIVGIDQFGRKVVVRKQFHEDEVRYDYREWMRVDLRMQAYKIILRGPARFRMTHFIGKCYTMSNKVGLVWGFDDSKTFRTFGDIHPTFKDYDDVKAAIVP